MFGTNDSAKGRLSGVTCCVSSCQHHGASGGCTAAGIKVEPEHAGDASETICSTYRRRPGT